MLTTLQRFFFTNSSLETRLYPPLECNVRFRPYAEADYDACVAIYRENEAGRFPPAHRSMFEDYLRRKNKAYLVAERDAKVVACGGVNVGAPNMAVLCYGLVDPEHQGQRIGTTLALLRIAQLPPHAGGVFVFIFAVHTSMPFFRRFGFIDHGTWLEPGSEEYPVGLLHVSDESLRCIRRVLDRRGVRVEGKLALHSAVGGSGTVKEVSPGRFRVEFGNPALEQQGNETPKPDPAS